ncbi:MAG: winged helix-turn-helix domain-containing protein [Armatimonadota bacterium]|nr:winged helix-turn-helix domain-containing protein [Armatimonadota bacterium]MDR7438150.1 winged helix-turn-helix domain-containing protein [Armatimonadota bacterium]MDR7471441.1 winged helix-turn-helix domain-containing protein [Armatimonadota bacterium]MDR7508082.1 winged helix-turn-helix domain-containing protein [Armatimonadota bacterium]MDR7510291.1 winged helix-turn-helix domain-containing protein [Armatimonadota bacterium]
MDARVPSRRVRPVETVLKALAYRRRLLLLAALADSRPQELRALAARLGVPLKTASRNLRVLERAGLVEGTVVRRRAYYRLPDDASGLGGAVASLVIEAVLNGRPRALSGAGTVPDGRRRRWIARIWSRVRPWLTRWTSFW